MKCKEPSSPLPLPTDEWMPFLSEYEHANPVASFCCLAMPGRDGGRHFSGLPTDGKHDTFIP